MTLEPIAKIVSPFKEKFGIPRQASLIQQANGQIIFSRPYDNPDAFIGLEGFSHLWIQFLFHRNIRDAFKPTVRPPRLGGNAKLGVFATRSSFRPNGLGLSLVKLHEIRTTDNSTSLLISCPDLLDGTPVFDIKPFVEYSDQPDNPVCGFANEAPQSRLSVEFTSVAARQLEQHPTPELCKNLKLFLEEMIGLDPRPAYQKNDGDRLYGAQVFNLEVKWRVTNDESALIESIQKI